MMRTCEGFCESYPFDKKRDDYVKCQSNRGTKHVAVLNDLLCNNSKYILLQHTNVLIFIWDLVREDKELAVV